MPRGTLRSGHTLPTVRANTTYASHTIRHDHENVGIPRAEPLVKNSTASSLATMVGMNAYGSTNG